MKKFIKPTLLLMLSIIVYLLALGIILNLQVVLLIASVIYLFVAVYLFVTAVELFFKPKKKIKDKRIKIKVWFAKVYKAETINKTVYATGTHPIVFSSNNLKYCICNILKYARKEKCKIDGMELIND